jgi:uncharacterized protein (TIGR00369 family)
MSPEKMDRFSRLARDFSQGFISYCGMTASRVESGLLEARLVVQPHHRQQDGFVHAGVMATLADHAAGYAAYTMVPEDHRILTIEFKVNFMRPAFGEELTCRARVLKPGKKVLVCEADDFDLRGENLVLVAKNLTTMASVPINDLENDR